MGLTRLGPRRFTALFVLLTTATVHGHAAELPQVLIIGDSISIGYTPHVTRMLQGQAVVTHNKGNAQHTGIGLKNIDTWVGTTRWDVIHFNWGLWDLCYRNPKSKTQGNRDKMNGTLTTSLADYERNLELLVQRLEKTGATLIWAHTTVVPEGEEGRKVGDDRKYNDAAARVMKKHRIAIDDLHKLSAGFSQELFTEPGNVHYKAEGYETLARQVVTNIEAALKLRRARPQ